MEFDIATILKLKNSRNFQMFFFLLDVPVTGVPSFDKSLNFVLESIVSISTYSSDLPELFLPKLFARTSYRKSLTQVAEGDARRFESMFCFDVCLFKTLALNNGNHDIFVSFDFGNRWLFIRYILLPSRINYFVCSIFYWLIASNVLWNCCFGQNFFSAQ